MPLFEVAVIVIPESLYKGGEKHDSFVSFLAYWW